jgi:hypothetical protein
VGEGTKQHIGEADECGDHGNDKLPTLTFAGRIKSPAMPKGLRRWYGSGDLHYITCSLLLEEDGPVKIGG